MDLCSRDFLGAGLYEDDHDNEAGQEWYDAEIEDDGQFAYCVT